MKYKVLIFSFLLMSLVGCVNIPQQAPELSAELGNRLNALQTANITLLNRFFQLKRDDIDTFIEKEWVPTFAKNTFSNPQIQQTWRSIAVSNNATDQINFLITLGPKLQEEINRKRQDLIRPLDEIEKNIEQRIREEYDQAKAINNSLTSLLLSSSKVVDNRNRYLEKIGVTDEKVNQAINQVDDVVEKLLSQAGKVQGKSDKYAEKLKEIKNSLISNNRGNQ